MGTGLVPLPTSTGHLSSVEAGGSGFCVVVVVDVAVVVAVGCWSGSLSWLSGNHRSASQHQYKHTMSVV